MTPSDWVAVAVPTATIALAACATYAGPFGTYLAERTHNERLGRVVAAAGRYAALASDQLSGLPAGADATAFKATLIQAAATQLSAEFAASKAGIPGATDAKLLGIVQAEFAKLPAKVQTSLTGTPAPVVAIASPVADPPPAEPVAPPPTKPAAPISVSAVGVPLTAPA